MSYQQYALGIRRKIITHNGSMLNKNKCLLTMMSITNYLSFKKILKMLMITNNPLNEMDGVCMILLHAFSTELKFTIH